MGEILLVWLVAFRRYFVLAARQLNAIRKHATSCLSPEGKHELVIQSTDPGYPPYWHASSAHAIILVLVSLLNAALLAAGTWCIVGFLGCMKSLPVAAGGVAAIVGMLCCRIALRERG